MVDHDSATQGAQHGVDGGSVLGGWCLPKCPASGLQGIQTPLYPRRHGKLDAASQFPLAALCVRDDAFQVHDALRDCWAAGSTSEPHEVGDLIPQETDFRVHGIDLAADPIGVWV